MNALISSKYIWLTLFLLSSSFFKFIFWLKETADSRNLFCSGFPGQVKQALFALTTSGVLAGWGQGREGEHHPPVVGMAGSQLPAPAVRRGGGEGARRVNSLDKHQPEEKCVWNPNARVRHCPADAARMYSGHRSRGHPRTNRGTETPSTCQDHRARQQQSWNTDCSLPLWSPCIFLVRQSWAQGGGKPL